MSLRVWLPLNGTLENKGLDDITPVLTGAVAVNNEGKIGKCYKFGTSLGRITIPPAIMRNYNECSISFWVNILGWQTNWDTFFQAGLGTSPWNSYTFGVLRNQSNHVVFAISDGSASSQGNYKSSDLALNTWYHLGFIYKSGHCCIYVNGNLYKDYSTNIIPNFSGINYISLGQLGNASNYQTNCKMNDVRIYDHALSPLEIKHISQGLILHYPLNRNGWGQENNIAVSKVANRSCTNFTYDPSTQEWTMTCPAASSSWGYGIAINDRNIKWAINQTWVISMEVYVPHSITWNCDINNKPDLTDISEYTGNDYDVAGQRLVCTNGIKGSKTLQAGWNKIWFSQTANTTYGLTNYSTNWGIQTTNESSDIDIKIRKIKGEVIASGLPIQPTSWCPNSSDVLATTMGFNGTAEYDCSGFCNNGTRTGAFSWTSDTPKYDVSTIFIEGCSINTINNLSNPCSEFSVGGWVNLMEGYIKNNGCHLISFNGTYCRICISKDGLAVRVLLTNGSTNYMGGSTLKDSALTANEWNYFVITFKNGIIKIYINGLLDADLTATITQINFPSSNISIGQYGSEKPNAKVSDFRFYVTALSADDVKSLYNNSAYIDNQGNIYGAVYEEV